MDGHVVIALFRHGLTEENKRKAYLGWNDSPLCAESKNLATSSTYECYFSSDLNRCIQTGNLLFPNETLTLLKELREMDFGQWQGKTYEELKGIKHYQMWINDPYTVCPPRGESFQQFSERVDNGWKNIRDLILSKDIQRCAVVTHGGVVKYLLSKYAPESKEFWKWQVPHGWGIELMFDREALRRGERCILLQEAPLTEKKPG